MSRSILLTLSGFLSLALWVVVAFVWALPSGWAHLPLVAGFLLLVGAIVEQKEKN